jgi:hypothetical protein
VVKKKNMTTKTPFIIQEWASSISERDAKKQADFYSKDAILLATYEPILLGKKEIYEYFIGLLSNKNIKCKITQNYSMGNEQNNVSSGLYTFSFDDELGNKVIVPARYTFVVNRNKIVDHHSSEEPSK